MLDPKTTKMKLKPKARLGKHDELEIEVNNIPEAMRRRLNRG